MINSGEFNTRGEKIQFLKNIESGKKVLGDFLPIKWVKCKEWYSRPGVIDVNGELMLREDVEGMFVDLEKERQRTGRIIWIEIRNYP